MYRLARFLKRYYTVFLFILLEGIAVNYYMGSTGYASAKIYNASSRITGDVDGFFTSIGDYFHLKKINTELIGELAAVQGELERYRSAEALLPAEHVENGYFYSTARVLSNTVNRQRNYFVIDKGADDGVERNMAVLSTGGAVAGFVQDCLPHHSVCVSVLNMDFRIGGRIKGKDYFGSIYWDGVSPHYATLSDIPLYAPVAKGDTILSAYSLRFPQDSHIGIVEDYETSEDNTYFRIKVKLDVDMYSLSNVMLIKYTDAEEVEQLLDLTIDNRRAKRS